MFQYKCRRLINSPLNNIDSIAFFDNKKEEVNSKNIEEVNINNNCNNNNIYIY